MWNGTGSWGGTGMWGTGPGMAWLTSNPDALQAWLQLKADHLAAMQTWYDTYKADLTTPKAQQALHDLWTKNWNDMKAFYEQYGGGATWTSPSDGMWGTGSGMAWLTSNPDALKAWTQLRADHVKALQAWYGHLQGRSHLGRTPAGAPRSLDHLLERHEGLLPAVRQRRHVDLPFGRHVGRLGHGRH